MRQKGVVHLFLLVFVALISIVLTGYLIYANFAVIQNSLDTWDWKTYTNSNYKLTFKYPSDYNFEETSLDVGIVAWMGILTSPRNIVNEDTKFWNAFAISVGVRRKMGLTLDEWVRNECNNKILNQSDLEIQGRLAIEMTCSLGKAIDNEEILWKVIAIDNDDYVYTIINNAYQRNVELDDTFSKLIQTFKFTQ